VDETDVVVVLELEHPMSKPAEQEAEIEVITSGLRNALAEAGALGIKIAYGSIASEIKEVSRSYKEARMAADVGRIFFEEKEVIAYSGLGIGRLIYQLPIPLCRLFIKEIFDGRDIDDFDDEILPTIDKFFENSLNVSETSRQLFIHRNTLVYRLDKIQKSTGLDLRVFDDAITFKIALMVVKYMKYMKKNEF
jgi:carbohydrate diacid regulator